MPKKKNKTRSFFHEFKRRKVWQVLVAYAGVAAIIIGISETIQNSFQLYEGTVKLVIIIFVAGLPLVGIITWILNKRIKDKTEPELSPPGINDKSIIVLPFENISSDPEQE